MDSDDAQWGPSPGAVLGVALAGIVFALVTVFAVSDAPGRLLGTVAAVSLLVFAVTSWIGRPKLRVIGADDVDGPVAPPTGLAVRNLFGTVTLAREDVQSVKVTEFRRLGRRARLLEIETADRLIVLNRWDLGTDPREVLAVLRSAGFTA